jgi:hypothetical protein
MKLTQFALAAILVLLTVAGYLTIKSDLDSRMEKQNEVNEKLVEKQNHLNESLVARMEDLSKKVAAPVPAPVAAQPAPAVSDPAPAAPPANPKTAAALAAATAVPSDAPLAPENDPRMLEDERKVLNLGAADRVADDSLNLPSALAGQPLTKVQQRIVALPAIAKIKEYAVKEGMIVLDRGTNANLKAGDQFALRRKTSVIGKVRISETINETECVADVLPGSMPPGMLPAVDDDVIQFE